MKKELKDKWLQALRSGEYRQTTELLRDVDFADVPGFCCLGVLGDVCGLAVWHESGALVLEDEVYDTEYDAKALALLGLDEDTQNDLINLNDTQRADFNEIANWIEANVEEEIPPMIDWPYPGEE